MYVPSVSLYYFLLLKNNSVQCKKIRIICYIQHNQQNAMVLLTNKKYLVYVWNSFSWFICQAIREDFNIMDIVLELRRQRPSAVQTKVHEFLFVHLLFICDSKLVTMCIVYMDAFMFEIQYLKIKLFSRSSPSVECLSLKAEVERLCFSQGWQKSVSNLPYWNADDFVCAFRSSMNLCFISWLRYLKRPL